MLWDAPVPKLRVVASITVLVGDLEGKTPMISELTGTLQTPLGGSLMPLAAFVACLDSTWKSAHC